MEGTITARPLDYFALLVGASIVALCSGVLATLCVKHEFRGLAWFFAAKDLPELDALAEPTGADA
jgi:hypothetical protein